jgi:3-phosphoshikimate 1-carboxyvinyltransferase
MANTQTVQPAAKIGGTVTVPGDKSISHRALLFSAVAQGETTLQNLSPGQDVSSTARVLSDLGVQMSCDGHGGAHVVGRGFGGLRAPAGPLDCGNSGTTMRLLMGLLAGRQFSASLVGDESLSQRPMARIATPLEKMGAQFELADNGRPPITVHGGPLTGITYHSPVASAQVKTAIILAGLQAYGDTVISEDVLSRDHTERMLWAMNAPLTALGTTVRVQNGELQALGNYRVPGDLSSAAFLVAAGLLVDGPGVVVKSVGLNKSRAGFLDAVTSMGARVEVTEGAAQGERVGHLMTQKCELQPLSLGGADLVRSIDEVPILAVLATQANGRSTICDAAELRVKESDRLKATAQFLSAMGAHIQETPDGLIIDGPTPLHSATIDAQKDHRIAMAAAVAGLMCGVSINGAECADVSYPGFFEILQQLAQRDAVK